MLLLSSTLLYIHPTSTTLFPVLSKHSVLVLSFEYLTDNSYISTLECAPHPHLIGIESLIDIGSTYLIFKMDLAMRKNNSSQVLPYHNKVSLYKAVFIILAIFTYFRKNI